MIFLLNSCEARNYICTSFTDKMYEKMGTSRANVIENRGKLNKVCHNTTTNKQKFSTGSNINVLIICEKMISDKAFLGYAFVESSKDLFLTSKKIAPSHSRTCEVYTLLTRKQHLSFSSVTKVL